MNEPVVAPMEGDEDKRWRFGAVRLNKQVELPAISRRPQDTWQMTATEQGCGHPLVTCSLLSADENGSPQAALSFAITVHSIADGSMETKGGDLDALCMLLP